EEHQRIEKWLTANDRNQVLLKRVLDKDKLAVALLDFQTTDTEKELKAIKAKLAPRDHQRKLAGRWLAAAVILAVLSISTAIYWFIENHPKPITQVVDLQVDL